MIVKWVGLYVDFDVGGVVMVTAKWMGSFRLL